MEKRKAEEEANCDQNAKKNKDLPVSPIVRIGPHIRITFNVPPPLPPLPAPGAKVAVDPGWIQERENMICRLKSIKIDIMERSKQIRDLEARLNVVETKGAQICIICAERPRNIVYSVCGHCVSCWQCHMKSTGMTVAGITLCPVCRSCIQPSSFIRIFW